jgi:predicted cobalt transporter CbtA
MTMTELFVVIVSSILLAVFLGLLCLPFVLAAWLYKKSEDNIADKNLAARADYEHKMLMLGNDYVGIYGQYKPDRRVM